VTTDTEQLVRVPKKYKIGPLANLNQVIKALGKTIRAMSNGTLDSADGARICNGLGILRTAIETRKLQELDDRMAEINRLLGARQITSLDRKLSIEHETNGRAY
jgi:hypothetical protein